MDIFRFINSRDVREYLKSRNYPFTSLEAAWLIYQCRCATIKEKHEAWQELIQTMPDCAVAERPHTARHESLHQFLKEYIRTEDEILDWFFRDEKDAIYNCEFWEYAMWCPGGGYFDSFQKCLKAYTDRRLGKMTFKITKEIVNSGQSIDVVFSADNEPLKFDTSWYPACWAVVGLIFQRLFKKAISYVNRIRRRWNQTAYAPGRLLCWIFPLRTRVKTRGVTAMKAT